MDRGSGLDRGWRFVPSASPVPWRATSLRGCSSRVVTELTCGPPSTRHLPNAWHRTFRPPSHERLAGIEWRVWAANSPCPPLVVLSKKSGPHPSWETVALLWGWVTVGGTEGHVFTAPRGTVIKTDRGVALQLTAEPLTTHVVVVVLQWGAERPQPRRDPVARVIWRDLPILQATNWSGGAGHYLPGALPWLQDCGDASPPPAEIRSVWRACMPPGKSPGLATTSWWPRTPRRSSATTRSRSSPMWRSAWPPTP